MNSILRFAALALVASTLLICTAAVPLRSLSPNSPVPTAADITASTTAEATTRAAADTVLTTNLAAQIAVVTNNTARIISETNRAQVAEALLTTNIVPVSRIATNLVGERVVTNISTLSTNVLFFDVHGLLTNLTTNP
jgi:hypothetical protein